MVKRFLIFLSKKRLLWPLIAVLAVFDSVLLYLIATPITTPSPVLAAGLPATTAAEPAPPPPPKMIHPPSVEAMLQSGTLIVVSKKSQRMFVFIDGQLWRESPVSTGKKGHETPDGVYPVLQKRVEHYSNLYDNAPMPFMQRLTWDGIALHAGRVPGYPASHGCVRIPHGTAKELFELNEGKATTVVIGDAPLANVVEARDYALTANLPIRSTLAPVPPPVKPVAQTPAMAPAQVGAPVKP